MGKYKIEVETHPGNVRKNNEDNYYIDGVFRDDLTENEEIYEDVIRTRKMWIASVFDGMGGMDFGERASFLSAAVMDVYCDRHLNRSDFDPYRMINLMNDRVVNENSKLRGRMGSTVVFSIINRGMLTVFNVGDSRAYMFRDGVLRQLSEDHTEANQLRKAAEKRGVMFAPTKKQEHVLTQCIGISEEEFLIEPFVSDSVITKKGDIYLLCSDGLYDMLSDEQIAFILNYDMKLADKRRQLVRKALEAGGRDNVTVALIEVVR